MGDISAEPSMEDILSSIKRIIAEEGETATAASRARRATRILTPHSEPGGFGHDEILELSDPVRASDEEAPVATDQPASELPAPFSRPVSAPVESILKQRVHLPSSSKSVLTPLATPEPVGEPVADSIPAPVADSNPAAPAAEPVSVAPAVDPISAAPAAEPIVSPRAADASRGSLDALSRLIVRPEVAGSDSLEGLVREMLRPMLREWLDSHLPAMVETMVSREIARITGAR
jgi:cell pole-organizing protein PopZ